jgi:hypothetical protein
LANHIFAGERKESSAKAQGDLIHDFVLKWSFFSANVQQELTSMRAETLKYSRPPPFITSRHAPTNRTHAPPHTHGTAGCSDCCSSGWRRY